MPLDEDQLTELLGRGWEALAEVMYQGKVTLRNGQEKQASMREIIAVAQFLASKQPPKSKKVPQLDGLRLERTDG